MLAHALNNVLSIFLADLTMPGGGHSHSHPGPRGRPACLVAAALLLRRAPRERRKRACYILPRFALERRSLDHDACPRRRPVKRRARLSLSSRSLDRALFSVYPSYGASLTSIEKFSLVTNMVVYNISGRRSPT